MSDGIVDDLRQAANDAGIELNASVADLLKRAADEIELLLGYRNEAESEASIASLVVQKLKEKPCPYVTGTVTQYCTLTPLTLTDAERAVIEAILVDPDSAPGDSAATLRGLLERTAL